MELTDIRVVNSRGNTASNEGDNARTSLLNRGPRNLYTKEQNKHAAGLGGSGTDDIGPIMPEYEYYELEVQPNDTVTKIALRYSLKPFDLKRINHLLRDQDLFSRKMIKIPLAKHGILAAQLNASIPGSLSAHAASGPPDMTNGNAAPDHDNMASIDSSSIEGDEDERASLLDRVGDLRPVGGGRKFKSWSGKDGKKLENLLEGHDSRINELTRLSDETGDAVDDTITSIESTSGSRLLYPRRRVRPWCTVSLDSWFSVRCLIVFLLVVVAVAVSFGVYRAVIESHHNLTSHSPMSTTPGS